MPSPEKRPAAANTAAHCTHARVVRANGASAGATNAAVVPFGLKGRHVNGIVSPFPDNAAYAVVHTTFETCETCAQYPTAPSADNSPSSIRHGHGAPKPASKPTEETPEVPSADEIAASNHVRRALTQTFTELSLGTTSKPSNIVAAKPSKRVPMFASDKQLKHYQHEDLEKPLNREDDHHSTAKGHIIAYPTGLGKTPLIIALVASTVKKATGPTLVIVPSVGIMRQWESECKKFAPDLKVRAYYKSEKPGASTLNKFSLVIATYRQILYQHGEHEAHGVRNHETRRANACYAIVSQTKRVLCLTATPAQNSFRDLFSYFKLLDVSDEGLNNWPDFRTKVVRPLLAGQAECDHATALLTDVLFHHVVWRPKELIDLPPLHIHLVDTVFTPQERCFYKFIQNMHHGRCAYVQLTRERQGHWQAAESVKIKLPVCDHGSLVGLELKPSDLSQADGYDSDVGEPAKEDPGDLSTAIAVRSYRSAKMRAAIRVLKEIRNRPGNEKTIVFSHFIDPLDILHDFLSDEGFSCAYYTGEMDSADRDAALYDIRCKPECTVILMSVKCGSDGLNIVSCNNMILLDPWWNPYVEKQPEKEASIDLLMGSFQDLKMEDIEGMLRVTRDDTTDV
ncbi:hypothetical protein DENSPDRAFT_847224 [Dentipellis sp. KUC8613]|nr:hypothetical protein DENSPDRAFT_847224 [Dentipellis sp. KUC8613]